MSSWFHRSGGLAESGWECVVDERSGLRHAGLRVGSGSLVLPAGPIERMILPLEGAVTVEHDGGTVGLTGRASVLAGAADTLYLGSGQGATVTATGRVAVAEARAERGLPPAVLRAADVPVERRGSGAAARQVRNLGLPGVLDAERLLVCEVITSAGHWSSYPPHKHDEHVPGLESRLEEIYWFSAGVAAGIPPVEAAAPFGLFAGYSSRAGELDLSELVRDGDVALIPHGYHGPAAAPPGYDLYYLNVMAGPGDERAWRISDDPAHGWIRTTWETP